MSGSHNIPFQLYFFSNKYVLLKSIPFPTPISINQPFFFVLVNIIQVNLEKFVNKSV